jgi:inorganic pyrophosphatase
MTTIGGGASSHPWHAVAVEEPVDESFAAVIETPVDSQVQYEIDRETGLLSVKRVLSSSVQYPANYGMIPRTLAPDGEAMDVLVIGQEAIVPCAIVRARAVGLLRYEQHGMADDKVIAVHLDDPAFDEYMRFDQLPEYWRAMLTRFFEDYRALDGQEARVLGFEGPSAAAAAIRRGLAAYRAAFGGATP